MKKIFAAFLISALASCGGSGGSSSTSSSDKNLAITVTNSRSTSTSSHGHIDYYLISVSGDDIEDDVTEMVDGTADHATVMGVPAGIDRQILVEAFNDNGVVIKRALKEGVEIYPGVVSNVSMAMKNIPIFTTRSGTATSNNRLNFEIYGEPGSKLNVINVTAEDEETLVVDASRDSVLVDTSAEDGLFSFDPGTLQYGNYIFKVEDIETHESSILSIALYKSLARPGMTLGSGGTLRKIHDELVISNIGGAFHQNTSNRVNTTGIAPFLQQLENIYEN